MTYRRWDVQHDGAMGMLSACQLPIPCKHDMMEAVSTACLIYRWLLDAARRQLTGQRHTIVGGGPIIDHHELHIGDEKQCYDESSAPRDWQKRATILAGHVTDPHGMQQMKARPFGRFGDEKKAMKQRDGHQTRGRQREQSSSGRLRTRRSMSCFRKWRSTLYMRLKHLPLRSEENFR